MAAGKGPRDRTDDFAAYRANRAKIDMRPKAEREKGNHGEKATPGIHDHENITSRENPKNEIKQSQNVDDCETCESNCITQQEPDAEPTTYTITTTDKLAHMRMVKADDLYSAMWAMDMKMRSILKHSEWGQAELIQLETQLECWREMINDVCDFGRCWE